MADMSSLHHTGSYSVLHDNLSRPNIFCRFQMILNIEEKNTRIIEENCELSLQDEFLYFMLVSDQQIFILYMH